MLSFYVSTAVKLYFKYSLLAEPPTIIDKSPPLIKAADGYNTTLICSVFGAPRPEIIWSRGNSAEDITSIDSRFNMTVNGTLEIQVT